MVLFQSSPKHLDPSSKMDLDYWIVFEGRYPHLMAVQKQYMPKDVFSDDWASYKEGHLIR